MDENSLLEVINLIDQHFSTELWLGGGVPADQSGRHCI